MLNEFSKIKNWIVPYIFQRLKKLSSSSCAVSHVFLCLCDHFEPLLEKADFEKGLSRVRAWNEKYPQIADKYKDSDGQIPKYTFFYPIEEYRPEYLELLSSLCHQGYGEVEIHLHHDDDTAENLRKQLNDFKVLLADKHKLLSRDKDTKEIKYGFIHGNWALNNSRPDGRRCGVNNELQVLWETGCYADFTMPSAPDITQPKIINSIYYADKDINTLGLPAGLLMVQGPLMLNWQNRKWGVFPKIENGSISYDCHVSTDRIKLWLKANIHIQKEAEYVFIKLYTHGCQEKNIEYLLNGGLDNLFTQFQDVAQELKLNLHYVTAREMVNIIKAIENNANLGNINLLRDYQMSGII